MEVESKKELIIINARYKSVKFQTRDGTKTYDAIFY